MPEHNEADWSAHYPWHLKEYNKISPFFDALSKSKIETTQCKSCNSIQWPPRSICSKCLSEDLKWVEVPKTGKIVGFSKAYIGLIDGEEAPIVVAAVHLEGGLRILTRIIGAKYEDLRVDLPVKLAKAALVDGKPYWAFSPA
jgi:uncharacterized OB-fold protein